MFSDAELQIIDALELKDFPPEEQEQVLDRVMNTVIRAVVLRAMLILPAEVHSYINALLESRDDPVSKTFIFLKENIADFEDLIREEASSVFERITLSI